jgi:hypothetical protein
MMLAAKTPLEFSAVPVKLTVLNIVCSSKKYLGQYPQRKTAKT